MLLVFYFINLTNSRNSKRGACEGHKQAKAMAKDRLEGQGKVPRQYLTGLTCFTFGTLTTVTVRWRWSHSQLGTRQKPSGTF